MIKSMAFQNFQSHRESFLDLHPGVNVIVGASDVGKTAILRGFRWAVWNRPQSDAFRSYWAVADKDYCIVEISMSTGNVVTRMKDHRNNIYLLKTPEGNPDDPLEFTAFKSEIPEEIQQALNLTEINLQRQFDRPYMLDNSPGEVAQHFNRVAHLDIIDITLRRVQSAYSRISRDIETDEERITEIQEELKKYEKLDEMDGFLTGLEQMESQRVSLCNSAQALSSTIKTMEELDNQIAEHQKILTLSEPLEEIERLRNQRSELFNERQRLSNTIDQVEGCSQQISQYELTIGLEDRVSRLLKVIEMKRKVKEERTDLANLLLDIGTLDKELKLIQNDLAIMETDWKKEFPETCPLCGTPRVDIQDNFI
jgi:exonuclease SbcC